MSEATTGVLQTGESASYMRTELSEPVLRSLLSLAAACVLLGWYRLSLTPQDSVLLGATITGSILLILSYRLSFRNPPLASAVLLSGTTSIISLAAWSARNAATLNLLVVPEIMAGALFGPSWAALG
ncbi:MAG: hypothetical protein ACUVWR_16795, partial [Anaerolineae bacterium]